MDKQRPAVRGALPVESSLALWECPRPAAELIVGRMSTGVFCRATGRTGLRMRGSGVQGFMGLPRLDFLG